MKSYDEWKQLTEISAAQLGAQARGEIAGASARGAEGMVNTLTLIRNIVKANPAFANVIVQLLGRGAKKVVQMYRMQGNEQEAQELEGLLGGLANELRVASKGFEAPAPQAPVQQ